jgi:pyruvate formate lyase activating enzyme
MRIGGIIDISTKDIPHRSSMVIFTVGCNFKCEFCHNKYLLQSNVGRDIEISELINKIRTNELVSGVSITGGEPTLQDDLVDLCIEIIESGKYLSIDTNGSNPKIIRKLVPHINRVALDLKGPLNLEKLEKIAGVEVNIEDIIETIKFLNKQADIDFEIRTTYVENLLSSEDIKEIIDFLRRIDFRGNFVLQQYQFSEGVGEDFKELFSKPVHDTLVDILSPYRDLEPEFPFRIFLRDEIVGYCAISEL